MCNNDNRVFGCRFAKMLAAACGMAVAGAYGATGVVTNGSEIVITVESGDSLEYSCGIGSGVTRFVKEGAGILTVAGDSSSFKGPVDINGGILKMAHCYSLGMSDESSRTTDGAITVGSGAQLYARLPRRSQDFEQISKRVILSGSGPYATEDSSNDKHYGALYVESYTDEAIPHDYAQDFFVAHVELAANAVLGFGGGRIGLKTTDLKGHKLVTGNWKNGFLLDFMLWNTVHLSAGTLEVYGEGKNAAGTTQPAGFLIVGGLTAPASGFVLSLDDSALRLDNSIGDVACNAGISTCNSNNDGKPSRILFGDRKWTDKAGYIFKGPISIGTATQISPKSAVDSSAKFEGAISGAGNLTVSGENFTLDLSGTGSTASGTLTVSDATVRLWRPGAIADYSKLTLSTANSCVECLLGSSGWTSTDYATAGNLVNAAAESRFVACTAEGETVTLSSDFTGSSFFHGGDGAFAFTGAFGNDATTTLGNLSGDFTVTGKKNRYVGDMRVYGGTLTLDGAGLFYKGEQGTDVSTPTTWVVGGSGEEQALPARLVVTGDTQFVAHPAKAYTSDSQPGGLHIGDTAGQGALVEFHSGILVTNSIRIAQAENEKGAVHQYGGDVFVCSHNNNEIYCGNRAGSYAYYGVYGGTLSYHSFFTIAHYPGSVGVIDQTSGIFQSNVQGTYIGGGVGRAEYYMTGGEFKAGAGDDTLTLAASGRLGADSGAQAVLTLTGNGNPQVSFKGGRGTVKLCAQTNDIMAVVNINSGVMTMRSFARGSNAAVCQPNNKAYVNFGGGTLREAASDDPYIFGNGATAVDKVTLFPGGLTIDTNGKSVSLSVATPLTRPAGRGIASVALPANMENGKYIGSPEVVISGGGGTGATAHAVYDPSTKSVTSIDVTCPGWGFTDAPTVTIPTADRTGVVNCIVTLTPEGQDQPGGGLVKTGNGRFSIEAVNTYTGDTVLSGGSIRIDVAGAIPEASTVVFDGGYLILNGNPAPTKWGVDCARVVANGTPAVYPMALTFPAGSTLTVLNMDAIPDNVMRVELLNMTSGFDGSPTLGGVDPQKWNVVWKGNKLVAHRFKGFSISFR